ncbi:MAG: hypothetical protein QXL09_03105 [Candidatus Aenigmatarchaeota archaeon]
MRGRYEELSCPFCDKGKIQAWYIPGAWSIKRKSTKTLPGHGTIYKSSDIWIIKSGCNVCGKSQEEVEKELKKKRII